MEVLQNRVASFSKHKRGKSLKWPHPKTWQATPDTLAEAGFYFDPSTDDPDNVTCFMCGKQVTEWAEDDDPFDIHWQKCAQMCAWASVRCGLRRDTDSRGRFVFPDKSRLPTSKAMEKARLQTFTGWKHDKNKKHMATSKKMAHAGFIFTPVEAGDDTGTCLFCNIALGNWDEDDDPMYVKHVDFLDFGI
ncbi:inhibitor of apoptosis repeat-containing protein [Mycena pura]|uniref:Inhibitor of apoptosis repeat-containing protein n=1 Tax=Mycena pura TaxID=153505 RepID=A0AAD6YVW8_9AGAR|nr:inhibitor of apoptosis repeat-containing protein [Mycena pura]